MLETLTWLPAGFWAVIAVLLAGGVWAVRNISKGIGLPCLVVLLTVAAWYVGDAFYNDYANTHVKLFTPDVLQSAWWQVAWFTVVFLLLAPRVHLRLNAPYLNHGSGALQMFKQGVAHPEFQNQLNHLFYGCILIWLVIIVIAALKLGGQIPYFFFPFLGYKAEPWGRGRIGSGFDALWSVIFYFQLLVTGIFGVVAALAANRKVQQLAVACCAFSWPYFIFDRTRNTMLAAMVPGVVCFALLRVRGGLIKKTAVLLTCFLMINAWMGFVIANRSSMSITAALNEKGFSLGESGKVHHEGLNMFEELCWLNYFMDKGSFEPNWGRRYFAELVNIIPRALWPDKPLIGIDYAIARGHGDDSGGSNGGGVNTTISTGFIGQGVNNFGIIIGPAFAALLMSIWAALLARLDLNIYELGNLPLYGSGLILTFNLGRDITLITLYPFLFGSLAIWWLKRLKPKSRRPAMQNQARPPTETGNLALGKRGNGLIALGRTRLVFPPRVALSRRSGNSNPVFRVIPRVVHK